MEQQSYKRNVLVCLITNVILAFLLIRAEHWNFSDGYFHEVVYGAVIATLIFVIPLLYPRFTFLQNLYQKAENLGTAAGRYLKENYRQILINMAVYTGAALIGLTAALIINKNEIITLGIISGCLAAASVWVCRSSLADHPEKLFAALALISGMFFIQAAPTQVGICWDDNFHYDGTIALLTVNGACYQSDAKIIDNVGDVALDKEGYTQAERQTWDSELNSLYTEEQMMPYNHRNFGTNTIAYIPYSLGLYFGRGLGLPYTAVFRMEKLFNLLFYIGIFCLAIRKLKFGKILVACIGLVPTNLFMTTSFSYDPWIISLTVLGYAYFFAALQERDKQLTNSEIVIMLGAFALACIPKALYVVLMLPLLFMPKDKFASPKQRKGYLIGGFAIAILLSASVLLPMFIHGAGEGDTRGGSNVNSAEQIRFIASEPAAFLKIISSFILKDYINPLATPQYCVNYAYLGFGRFLYVAPVTLLLTGLLDRKGISGRTMPVTIGTIIAVVLAIILIPTALYISYTDVRATTVYGCQHRYLMPVVFPALYINGFDSLKNRISSYIFASVPMLIMALLFISDLAVILAEMY
ncbi:MAG: DUF2142 domain-containing protein [Erysipelotrichaceae bacterium]|nr:DUF2142 domain-containing protein [Erysipelotrichaceae bacterium]